MESEDMSTVKVEHGHGKSRYLHYGRCAVALLLLKTHETFSVVSTKACVKFGV